MNVLQLVTHGSGPGVSRGVGGPEIRAIESLRFWPESLNLTICYSSKGRLFHHVRERTSASTGRYHLIDYYIRGKADWSSVFYLQRLIRKNDIQLIHTQGSYATDLYAAITSRIVDVPHIITRPVVFSDNLSQDLTSKLYKRIDDWCLRYATNVVAVSKYGYSVMVTSQRVPRDKLYLVYNGIDLNRFSPEKVVPLQELEEYSRPIIVMVAQMLPHKGHRYLLRSMKRIWENTPNPTLVLVGDGPERTVLEREFESEVSENKLLFMGLRRDIPSILAACDIFVLSSLREGFPVAIIEAMAMGLPVIASNIAGVPELIDSGSNGFLVQPGDVDELSLSLLEVISNIDLAKSMGIQGRRIARREYSIERMVSEYHSLYQKTILQP